LPIEAFRIVVDLNLFGTLLPILIFGESMQAAPASRDKSIVTVSSMAADRALTRVGGYGAAKAAVESLTRWLAVEWAVRGSGIRVNAIAPGFFVADQNRALLYEQDGSLSERGAAILGRTPAGRFGDPEDVVATVIWLCSPGSRFVTGTVVPIDGGFSAYGGV
jgi:NAD(P)-dependent dehydrogenase (short-subunit alcohol dehydrogenase family)